MCLLYEQTKTVINHKFKAKQQQKNENAVRFARYYFQSEKFTLS